MATYNSLISRAGSGSDPLVPEPVSAQIIQELPTQSAILQRARMVPMGAKTQRLPVLDVLPMAYFVGGDTGLKQSSSMAWKNVNLVAEEIATIVPIPEAYLDDSQVPIWDEVRPRMVEAIGGVLDSACFFGVGKPTTWSQAIYDGAVAAGNTVTEGSGVDLAQEVANLGGVLADDGYSLDAFVARPGLNWKLVGLRNTQGTPIYVQSLSAGTPSTLYGYDLNMVDNGSWDRTKCQILGGDWDNAIIGTRQDISFKMFTEGVISDDTGKVILNLLQQDAVAMRVVVRFAYATANPVTKLNSNSATRYPFAALVSAGSGS